MRYEVVRKEYERVIGELGGFAYLVPKSYIYEEVRKKTGLSARTVVRAVGGK